MVDDKRSQKWRTLARSIGHENIKFESRNVFDKNKDLLNREQNR